MATFMAIVRTDGEFRYTASFPDFPGCTASAPTVDLLIAKAREALSMRIERMLEVNQMIGEPTAAEAIDRGDALLLAAVDVPDDLRIAHIDLAIPALALARIDSLAGRHGLTRAALFVAAANRWVMQEAALRERRGGQTDGPTLFDFSNPPELKVERIALSSDPRGALGMPEPDLQEETEIQTETDAITAELVRLLEERSEPEPLDGVVQEGRNRPGS